MRLAGKRIVVTGGTRGLGRALTERFLHEGARVMCAARNPYDIKELDDIHPGRVHYHSADVTDEQSVAELTQATLAVLGGADVLVCNAGVSRDGKIGALSLTDWQDTVATNLTGVFLTTRAFAPHLSAGGQGRIITMSSCVATRPTAGAAAYGASKAAVETFTRTASVELGPSGVTVNCLAPGYFDEGMGKQVAANPALWERYRKRLVQGRLGDP
ncbi:SDR family NAD(P)-dependent oxidoreductase [Actinoplanes sp. TFC3]|uniref:SDR family NAD(P)-dependent oxidoreductase n=1 Tax=Actinoplanes sp. TFC3 TaxID=1710355 RepID=UPI000AFC4DC7|nr:SDR family NAD(P)-dependent oxidoreductase [Actinoplanes sp. TFC3]